MDVVSYKYAVAMGLPRYFTGKPCGRGHVAERRTNGRCCIVCSSMTAMEWANKNKERSRETATAWNKKNAKKEAARARKYRAENKHVYKQSIANWRKKNAIRYKAYMAKAANDRRAAELQAFPKWAKDDKELVWVLKEIYELAALRTKMTGIKWHVDHIVPLRGKEVSGLHLPWNLQVIPAVMNFKKGNKLLGVSHGSGG